MSSALAINVYLGVRRRSDPNECPPKGCPYPPKMVRRILKLLFAIRPNHNYWNGGYLSLDTGESRRGTASADKHAEPGQ